MKDKAHSNLRAAKSLLERGLPDPAMSRLYYAMFQAAIYAHEAAGHEPGRYGKAYEGRWNHKMICNNVKELRGRVDDRALLLNARAAREQADYEHVPVDASRVEGLLEEAESFIKELCDE